MRLGIRTRLTLLSIAVNGVLLAVVGWALILFLSQNLYDSLDTFLESEGLALSEATSAFLDTFFIDDRRSFSQTKVIDVLKSEGFNKVAVNLFEPRRDFPNPFPITKALFDPHGVLVLTSHSVNAQIPPDAEVLQSLQKNGRSLRVVSTRGVDGNESWFRILAVPVLYRKAVVAVIQITSPLESLESTLTNLKALLGAILPLILLMTGLAVVFVLRGAFSPVRKMIDTALRVTEKNLVLRVPVPRTRDDISRLAQTFNAMLDRLDQAFSFQTRLFQDLSHQLKTPLAVLRGTLETGLTHLRSVTEYEEILTSNLEEVDRMSRLIESLLMLAKLDAKSLELQVQALDLPRFVDGLIDDFGLLWDQKRLRFRKTGTTDLVVFADEARLRQALLNILDNASKHSPVGGSITLDFGLEGSMARLLVTNEGPPIPADKLELIFERFSRGDEAGAPGFGLGLSITRSIVQLHGGRVRAFNPSNGGAAFEIVLPVKLLEH